MDNRNMPPQPVGKWEITHKRGGEFQESAHTLNEGSTLIHRDCLFECSSRLDLLQKRAGCHFPNIVIVLSI